MSKKHIIILVVTITLGFALFAQPTAEVQANIASTITVGEPAVQASASQTHEDGLLYMSEEEKIARDVYIALYEYWGFRTFANIANAEQQHMDMVAYLLDVRGLDNPVADLAYGEFKSESFAKLYSELVAQGTKSIEDAIKVGCLIEDLDIYDLDRYISNTTNESELWVYGNLKRGSENHMRSFSKQLARYNETYTAQYLSEADLSAILLGK